jgi:hypothetical protein
MSWRAPVPDLLPGEQVSWKCVAQRQDPGGVWAAAGDLYVTQRRLIWQAPRWARPVRQITLSYLLADCTRFVRGDSRPMGHSWGAQVWKRMSLELTSGEVVALTVRRAKRAEQVVSHAIELARDDRSSAVD